MGIAIVAVFSSIVLFKVAVAEWAWVVFPLTAAVLALANLSATVRRLHDRNHSGYWLLAFGLLPLIAAAGIYSSGFLREPFSGWAFFGGFGIAMALGLWASVEIDFLPGTPGPNRYGPPPE